MNTKSVQLSTVMQLEQRISKLERRIAELEAKARQIENSKFIV
jgi:uncharacterized small protein (DUF1192 family)